MPGPGLMLVGEEEEALVLEALRSHQLSRYRFDDEGEATPSCVYRFERLMEETLGVSRCLGTNSCTSALWTALKALGVGPGDEVLVPGYTFIATIAAVCHAGATPVLCEVDETLTLDVARLSSQLTPRTRAIVPVHMLGVPCDMPALTTFARDHGLFLVEDVAQACGGRHGGRALGSFGDAAAFSLNVFKTMTAGDGGLLATSRNDVFERAFALHDHGARPFRLGVMEGNELIGLNLRMHELTGAVALAQARKLSRILELTRARQARLREAVGDLPGARLRPVHDEAGDCGNVLAWLFDDAGHAARVAAALGVRRPIESGKHYYANMLQIRHGNMATDRDGPFFGHRADEFAAGALPRTDDVLARTVMLAVGVHDTYLGAGYGVSITASDDEVREVARRFRTVVLDAAS